MRIKQLPLCQIGWEFVDSRCKTGFSHGISLLDGNYRSSWDFYKLPQRLAMVSSLAFLKGGADKIPPGLMIPISTDGRYLKTYIWEVLRESIRQRDSLKLSVAHKSGKTVLSKRYDVLCPLPSSRGPASPSNLQVAHIVAKALSDASMNDNGPPVEQLIRRHTPMKVKSTATSKEVRKDLDAPRLMHFDTISIVPELLNSIQGKSILLYDDVITWGNTSEACRNLLLFAGAAEVDCVTCMSTGDLTRAAQYEFIGTPPLSLGECLADAQMVKSNEFRLINSQPIDKALLRWENQPDIKTWHKLFDFSLHLPTDDNHQPSEDGDWQLRANRQTVICWMNPLRSQTVVLHVYGWLPGDAEFAAGMKQSSNMRRLNINSYCNGTRADTALDFAFDSRHLFMLTGNRLLQVTSASTAFADINSCRLLGDEFTCIACHNRWLVAGTSGGTVRIFSLCAANNNCYAAGDATGSGCMRLIRELSSLPAPIRQLRLSPLLIAERLESLSILIAVPARDDQDRTTWLAFGRNSCRQFPSLSLSVDQQPIQLTMPPFHIRQAGLTSHQLALLCSLGPDDSAPDIYMTGYGMQQVQLQGDSWAPQLMDDCVSAEECQVCDIQCGSHQLAVKFHNQSFVGIFDREHRFHLVQAPGRVLATACAPDDHTWILTISSGSSIA